MLSYRKAAHASSPEELVPQALPWIIEAGNPYYKALFGNAQSTLVHLQRWVCRASSEVSIHRVVFLVSDSEFAGGFIALSGGDLRKARRADSVALLTSVAPEDRPALALRLANVSELMPPVGDDEYYLSKLGLAQKFRGKRLARTLVDRYIEDGLHLGYSRFRLDVHADNEPAIRCYCSVGFRTDRRSQSQDGSLKYNSMTYEVGRP
jgi:ribosomal protein S18 acetylase RimI-like enzyme